MTQKVSPATSLPVPLSKHAAKRRLQLQQAADTTIDLDPVEPQRQLKLRARVSDFNPRTDKFIFVTAEDGGQLFLSKFTILKCGLKISAGCTLICDTVLDHRGRLPRVTIIRDVIPPPKVTSE